MVKGMINIYEYRGCSKRGTLYEQKEENKCIREGKTIETEIALVRGDVQNQFNTFHTVSTVHSVNQMLVLVNMPHGVYLSFAFSV